MYKKFGKYLLWGVLGIVLLILGIRTFYQVAIYPGEVRKECAIRALEFVKSKQKTEKVYGTSEADIDYKFVYQYCFQEKGLKPE